MVLLFFFFFCKTNPSCLSVFTLSLAQFASHLPQTPSHKSHRSHMFEECSVQKSLSSLILFVPASLFLSWGICFLSRVQPSLLCIIPAFLHRLCPGSYRKRLTTHGTNPDHTITICSLPRNKKESVERSKKPPLHCLLLRLPSWWSGYYFCPAKAENTFF